MDLIFGVLTLSFGVYALIKGRLQLSKKYVLEGNSAKIGGLLLVIAPVIGGILTLSGQVDSAIFGCSCYSIFGVLAFVVFQAWKSTKDKTQILNIGTNGKSETGYKWFVEMVKTYYGQLNHTFVGEENRENNQVDIITISEDKDKWLVRCIPNKDVVSEDILGEFYGTMLKKKADRGVIITLGTIESTVFQDRYKGVEVIGGEQFLAFYKSLKSAGEMKSQESEPQSKEEKVSAMKAATLQEQRAKEQADMEWKIISGCGVAGAVVFFILNFTTGVVPGGAIGGAIGGGLGAILGMVIISFRRKVEPIDSQKREPEPTVATAIKEETPKIEQVVNPPPEIICSNCGNVGLPEDRFCRKCGSPINLDIHCKKCGHIVQPKDLYCVKCGFHLDK
ncbi:MAG: zinc ribbon domain-containing protein [Chloroflexi bacterium]|nr:zinc ribbon domain-containing protein [Chloroflexota bacterium]